MMWKDDAGVLQNALVNIMLNIGPGKVDCCANSEPHYFFYRHRGNRGSGWAWCSNCHSYVHLDGINVPPSWENPTTIPSSILSAIPESLEEKKEIADEQIKMLFKSFSAA